MNYYLARDCPYPLPQKGDVIGFDRTTAEGWDVKYIMKTASDIPANTLYEELWPMRNSSFYLQITDSVTYDMLDAFGVPHLNNKGHNVEFAVVKPQIIGNKNGSRTITIDRNTKDIRGPKGRATMYIPLHLMNKNIPNETISTTVQLRSYELRIGDLLIMPDNTVQKII